MVERIDEHRGRLTPAERRVADVVLADPEAVAFGTVADLAQRSGTSGASVVRLAARLGFDGFSALQAEIQAELTRRLRSAAERIRDTADDHVVGRALEHELDNVQATLEAVEGEPFDAVVALLADRRRRVLVLPSDAALGVGLLFADALHMLRPGVHLLQGTDVRIARDLADAGTGDVVVAIDLRRYDRWLIRALRLAGRPDVVVVAITDSALAPIADRAEHTLVVRAASAGPFDSHVGTLALTNALATGVAARLRTSAASRLGAIEAAWRSAQVLDDGSPAST